MVETLNPKTLVILRVQYYRQRIMTRPFTAIAVIQSFECSSQSNKEKKRVIRNTKLPLFEDYVII